MQVSEAVQVAPTEQVVNLVAVENNQTVTTSLKVAEVFGKQHKNVIQAIKSLDCSEDFHKLNFQLMQKTIKIGNGAERQSPMYHITRDGFMFLVMGFTGKTAAEWKEAYIRAFNEMEAKLRAEQTERAIKDAVEKERIEDAEYKALLEREDREEAEVDRRVEELARKRAKAAAQAEANKQGGIIEDYNGKRVVSSLTLARLQNRRHYYVCDSVRRMKKYFARPGRVIYKGSRIMTGGKDGHQTGTSVVYYITIEAFRTMCKKCNSVTEEVQREVFAAFNKAKGYGNHGKPVPNAHVPRYRLKQQQAQTTATPTAKPQTPQAQTVATMPQTPNDLMQRFVKAMGVMMGMDTNEMFNLMQKGE